MSHEKKQNLQDTFLNSVRIMPATPVQLYEQEEDMDA